MQTQACKYTKRWDLIFVHDYLHRSVWSNHSNDSPLALHSSWYALCEEKWEPTTWCSFVFCVCKTCVRFELVAGAKWILQTDDNIIAFMIVLKIQATTKKWTCISFIPSKAKRHTQQKRNDVPNCSADSDAFECRRWHVRGVRPFALTNCMCMRVPVDRNAMDRVR